MRAVYEARTSHSVALVQLGRLLLPSSATILHRRTLGGAWRRRACGAHLTARTQEAVCSTGAVLQCCLNTPRTARTRMPGRLQASSRVGVGSAVSTH